MTGKEFEAWIKRLGFTKARAAVELGINKDTITACCQADTVKRRDALALMGLAAMLGLSELRELSESIGEINANTPKKDDK